MSQCDTLLLAMRAGHAITPLVAYKLTGSLACHSRIAELRSRGHVIDCEVRREGQRKYGVYTLREAHAVP